MANLKELRIRIKSIQSTKKITSAMKLIAAAKLRKAQEIVIAARPYAQEMSDLLVSLQNNLSSSAIIPKLLKGTGQAVRHLVIVLTSDRGLCGGFNSTIIRYAKKHLQGLQSLGKEIQIIVVGYQGSFLLKKDYESQILKKFPAIITPRFFNAEVIAEEILNRFEANEIDVCTLIYTRFISALQQKVENRQLIPYLEATPLPENSAPLEGGALPTYTYEPSQEEVLNRLLVRNIKVQIYQALLESAASEHGARMTAMDGATRNADTLLSQLNLTYNRTRQAYITKELIEIISGAEAL